MFWGDLSWLANEYVLKVIIVDLKLWPNILVDRSVGALKWSRGLLCLDIHAVPTLSKCGICKVSNSSNNEDHYTLLSDAMPFSKQMLLKEHEIIQNNIRCFSFDI